MSRLEEFIRTFKTEPATNMAIEASKRSHDERVVTKGHGWEFTIHLIRGGNVNLGDESDINAQDFPEEDMESFILGTIHVLTIDFSLLNSMGKDAFVDYLRNIFVGNLDQLESFCKLKAMELIADYIETHMDRNFNITLGENTFSVRNKKINFVMDTVTDSSNEVSIKIADMYKLYEDCIDDKSGVGEINFYDIHVAVMIFGVMSLIDENSIAVFGDWYSNIHTPEFGELNYTELLTQIAIGQIGGILKESDVFVYYDDNSLTLSNKPNDNTPALNSMSTANILEINDFDNKKSMRELTNFINSLFDNKPDEASSDLKNRVVDAMEFYTNYEEDIEEDDLAGYIYDPDTAADVLDGSYEDDEEGEEPPEQIINNILTPKYYAVGSICSGECFILSAPIYMKVNTNYPCEYLVFPTYFYFEAEIVAQKMKEIINNIRDAFDDIDDNELEEYL